MIEKIYSKVDKKLILFSAMNIKDVSDGRIDSSPEKEYLQSSISNLKKGGADFFYQFHVNCSQT